jgi:hypothetical protein
VNRREKKTGKTIAGKLVVIRKVDKNERSEIAQAYGIPLSTLSTYFKNRDSIEQQASQGCNISKHMRIHGTRHGNMEYEPFEWFCHDRKNRLAVDGQTVNMKADEIDLKMRINFICSNG